MTQDEIIRMAREAGFEVDEGLFPFEAAEDKYIGTERTLERFAALVAAHKREKQAEQAECPHGVDDGACKECYMEQAEQRSDSERMEPVAIGTEWKPCMKLPVVVHVREQREGESHVSTREGITPVRPDDLIMRGVAGEEYPIGRELFNRTYAFDTTAPQPVWSAEECDRVVKTLRYIQGIVERGELRAMREDETLEQFVLGYVKKLEQPVKDRFFCQRCGKRVGDKNGAWDGIHTCTPPDDCRAVIAADREKNK